MKSSGQYSFSFLFRPLCLLSLCFCLLTPPVVFAAKISHEAKESAKKIAKLLDKNETEGTQKLQSLTAETLAALLLYLRKNENQNHALRSVVVSHIEGCGDPTVMKTVAAYLQDSTRCNPATQKIAKRLESLSLAWQTECEESSSGESSDGDDSSDSDQSDDEDATAAQGEGKKSVTVKVKHVHKHKHKHHYSVGDSSSRQSTTPGSSTSKAPASKVTGGKVRPKKAAAKNDELPYLSRYPVPETREGLQSVSQKQLLMGIRNWMKPIQDLGKSLQEAGSRKLNKKRLFALTFTNVTSLIDMVVGSTQIELPELLEILKDFDSSKPASSRVKQLIKLEKMLVSKAGLFTEAGSCPDGLLVLFMIQQERLSGIASENHKALQMLLKTLKLENRETSWRYFYQLLDSLNLHYIDEDPLLQAMTAEMVLSQMQVSFHGVNTENPEQIAEDLVASARNAGKKIASSDKDKLERCADVSKLMVTVHALDVFDNPFLETLKVILAQKSDDDWSGDEGLCDDDMADLEALATNESEWATRMAFEEGVAQLTDLDEIEALGKIAFRVFRYIPATLVTAYKECAEAKRGYAGAAGHVAGSSSLNHGYATQGYSAHNSSASGYGGTSREYNQYYSDTDSTDGFLPEYDRTLTMNDLYKVAPKLNSLDNEQLKKLGGALGLSSSLIRMKNIDTGMPAAWLIRQDNVLNVSGNPTYRSLCKALVECGLNGTASDIRRDMKPGR